MAELRRRYNSAETSAPGSSSGLMSTQASYLFCSKPLTGEGPDAVHRVQSVQNLLSTEPRQALYLVLRRSRTVSVICFKQIHHVYVDVLDIFRRLWDQLRGHRERRRKLGLLPIIDL